MFDSLKIKAEKIVDGLIFTETKQRMNKMQNQALLGFKNLQNDSPFKLFNKNFHKCF